MQAQSPLKREIINELYRTLLLLGADNGLLGTVGSWGDSLPDEDVLANLKDWNGATLKESTARIEHYGMSFCPSGYIQDGGQQTALQAQSLG